MPRRHQDEPDVAGWHHRDLTELHAWAASLPWVVTREIPTRSDGHVFGVDCEPIGHRQIWMVTGFTDGGRHEGSGVAVIVPAAVGQALERRGWGTASMSFREPQVLFEADDELRSSVLEAVVLTAYQHAIP